MILDVPFVYRLKAVPVGKRKPVDVYCRDKIPVFVQDLEPENAPVAFRCGPRPHTHVDQPPGEIFMTADRLIAPIPYNYLYAADDERTPTKSNIAVRVAACTKEDNPFHSDQDPHGAWCTAREFTAGDWRKVMGDNREARVVEISQAAAAWAFVGETMCRSAVEPVWHVVASPANDRMMILLRQGLRRTSRRATWAEAACPGRR